MTRQKAWITAARIISLMFTPFYLPLIGIALLFLFTYMNSLPWQYKILILLTAFLFTILLPTLLIRAYRRMQGWTRIQLGQKERRMVPYLISILCYFLCIGVMKAQHVAFFIHSIVLSALIIQITCVLINTLWKISTHMAAIGGVAGGVLAFTHIFIYNPVWWLCVVFLVAGLLGTARMILRQHSLAQVVAGFAVGFIGAAAGILRGELFAIIGTLLRIIANIFIKIFI